MGRVFTLRLPRVAGRWARSAGRLPLGDALAANGRSSSSTTPGMVALTLDTRVYLIGALCSSLDWDGNTFSQVREEQIVGVVRIRSRIVVWPEFEVGIEGAELGTHIVDSIVVTGVVLLEH